ncbi:MAG: hypothetical protein ABSA17_02530 [Rhabdochlamydiaceae bacterium]|jgi:hypothetical protein
MSVKHSTESAVLTTPQQQPSPNSLKTRMLTVLNSTSNNFSPEKDDWSVHDIKEVDPETVRQFKKYFAERDAKIAAKQQTTNTPSIFE